VHMSNSVTSIGDNAFKGCSSLRVVITSSIHKSSLNATVIYSQLLEVFTRLSILVVPFNHLKCININEYSPRCSVLPNSPSARIKAAQAHYWTIHGMKVTNKDERMWLLEVLLSLDQYCTRERLALPNEMICAVLQMIEWSDLIT